MVFHKRKPISSPYNSLSATTSTLDNSSNSIGEEQQQQYQRLASFGKLPRGGNSRTRLRLFLLVVGIVLVTVLQSSSFLADEFYSDLDIGLGLLQDTRLGTSLRQRQQQQEEEEEIWNNKGKKDDDDGEEELDNSVNVELAATWQKSNANSNSNPRTSTAAANNANNATLKLHPNTNTQQVAKSDAAYSNTVLQSQSEIRNDNQQQQQHNMWKLDPDNNWCARLMGNGFDETIPVCTPKSSNSLVSLLKGSNKNNNNDNDSGSLECHRNPITGAVHCQGTNLRIDPTKIEVSRGGEHIHHVTGRHEDDELPTYKQGAFFVPNCEFLLSEQDLQHAKKKDSKFPHYLGHIMNAVQTTTTTTTTTRSSVKDETTAPPKCTLYEERPTLMITRYEYANLYHSYTDWYNIFQAAMIALDGNVTAVEQANIIFLDGHSQGALDDMWKLLFPRATISFVSQLKSNDNDNDNNLPTCFRHAIFVSPGYHSPLSVLSMNYNGAPKKAASFIKDCKNTVWQQAFRKRLINNAKAAAASGNIQRKSSVTVIDNNNNNIEITAADGQLRGSSQLLPGGNQEQGTVIQVLFLSRQDYHPHPRSSGKVSRRIENEPEVLSSIRAFTRNNPNNETYDRTKPYITTNVTRVRWEENDMATQILLMQNANVVIGMHGAGLSHIMMARPGTVLLELKPPGWRSLNHFWYLATLAGCPYMKNDLQVSSNTKGNEFVPYPVPLGDFQKTLKTSIDIYLEHQKQ